MVEGKRWKGDALLSNAASHPPSNRPPTGSSFAARFGRVILQHGIAALPAALYHFGGKLDLYAQHVWFISYILSHKWDEDLPYPSLGVMSRCSGMSKRQLQRYSDELRVMGYLQVYPRVSQERGQEANAYDFAPLFGRLEACIIEQRKDTTPGDVRMSNPEIGVPIAAGKHPAAVGYANGSEETWASLNELERSERDTSFVARYGRVIARYGVAAVPRALFTFSAELGMTPQQVWFIAYIFSYQWDTALPYPSIMRMAALTGYTPAYLHRLKASLIERDYLRLVHRTKSDGGQDSNAYDFSQLLEKIGSLLQPSQRTTDKGETEGTESPAGARLESQEPSTGGERRYRRGSLAVRQRRDRQAVPKGGDSQYIYPNDARYTDPGVTEYIAPSVTAYTDPTDVMYIYPRAMQYIGSNDAQVPAPATGASLRPATRRLQDPATQSKHKLEAKYPEKEEKDDSSQISPENKEMEDDDSRQRYPYSSYIVQVITDFSYELGDASHIMENASQAQRLWHSSGLSERDFVEMMYSAKRSTREGQGKHGAHGLSNKMAYFFACLRRLAQGGQ